MQIDRETWSTLSPLLDEALDLVPAELEAWLLILAARQADAATQIRALLARRASVETSDFLGALPALGSLVPPADASASTPLGAAGTRVGPYLLDLEIGRGGMGVVWRATGGDSALRRTVALKLLYPGAYGADLLERFARERDILAGLEHPNIARLYDAGVADAGQPYLALEYVAGQPLDRFCDEHTLSVRARVVLFRQVLEAVAFAHSRLVIHRDLKPSNVLVTAEGAARLLDFGVAKLVREPGTPESLATELSVRVMTPHYAAPEQIAGETITTATDIYALGVMLYELLAGRSPYRPARDSRGALEDAILEADPVPPSQAPGNDAAAARATTPARLRASLSGDWDTITLKALKKRPADRYATVNALLQDLDNALAGVPVLAHPDSAWYRARKFARRHVVGVGAVGAVAAALVAGMALTLWQGNIARRNAERAVAIETFTLDLFRTNADNQPDPQHARATTARELLALGAARIESSLVGQPEARLAMLRTLGSMHHDLGLDAEAERLFREAIPLADALAGPESAEALEARLNLFEVIWSRKPGREPLELLHAVGAAIGRHPTLPASVRAAFALQMAESLHQTDRKGARDYAEQAAALCRLAPSDCDLSEALYRLGSEASQSHDFPAAAAALEESIRVARASGATWQRILPRAYAILADTYFKMQRPDDAESAFRTAYDEARRLKGSEHRDTFQTELRYGRFLVWFGSPREGIVRMQGAYEAAARVLGANDVGDVQFIESELGSALAVVGRAPDAIPHLRHVVTLFNPSAPPSRYAAAVHRDLAGAYLDVGRLDEAQAELDASAAAFAAAGVATSDPMFNGWRRIRAVLALDRGQTDAAKDVLKDVVNGPAGSRFEFVRQTEIAGIEADIDLRSGNLAGALARNRAVIARLDADPSRRRLILERLAALSQRARIASAEGRCGDATVDFEESIGLGREALDPHAPAIAESLAGLAGCEAALARPADAQRALGDAEAIARTIDSRSVRLESALRSARTRVAALR